ncbi:MAG: hypothetical protein VX791_11780 [Pseudomonadota bacterium]|nr:hypothetical protein [Pseudomonadota bacterium]
MYEDATILPYLGANSERKVNAPVKRTKGHLCVTPRLSAAMIAGLRGAAAIFLGEI